MERWLWFVLFALVGVAAYDYGRRTEREAPLQAELSVYRERDKLRDELAAERRERGKAIADAVARVAVVRDRERIEAAATDLARCPVPADLDQLRRTRDAEANAAIDAAYRSREQPD
mgnify:CR=1 FL=1